MDITHVFSSMRSCNTASVMEYILDWQVFVVVLIRLPIGQDSQAS